MSKALLPLLSLLLGGALQAAPSDTDAGAIPPKPARSQGLPADWAQGPFMEVFVRAYQDSDGDGQGDLKGLIARLDYLKQLGVSGLWLMPVTKSADRDHGYATTDFRAIEADYGSLADFDELLKQAHARGIGIVIDYVVNHSAAQHPFFLDALKGGSKRDWFVWSEQMPVGWDIWGKNPWYWAASKPWTFPGEPKDLPKPPPAARGHYFGTFGPHMPDFNLGKPEVVDWHLDNLRFWLNRGLDGFRLDAVPHLIERNEKDWNDQPESRQLTKRLYDAISAYPGRYTVCEATAEPQAYSSETVCGSAFAFGLERAILEALKADKPEAVQQNVQKIGDFFKARPHRMATMLANHDIFAGQRIWDQLKGEEAKYRLAAASYLLQPGIPFIYYGEEIGMAGDLALAGDGPIRGPMSWSATGGFSTAGSHYRTRSPNAATHNAAAQLADAGSLFHHYRQLVQLRRAHPALGRGSYENVRVDGSLLSFERRAEGQALRVWLNYSAAPRRIAAPGATLWAAPAAEAELLPAWGVRVERLAQ